jgi:hypothetical protein
LRRALDIRLRPWAFRYQWLLLRYIAGGDARPVATNGLESGRLQGFLQALTGNMSDQVMTVRCGNFFGLAATALDLRVAKGNLQISLTVSTGDACIRGAR